MTCSQEETDMSAPGCDAHHAFQTASLAPQGREGKALSNHQQWVSSIRRPIVVEWEQGRARPPLSSGTWTSVAQPPARL